jgi:hypothetical protein
VPFLVPRMQFSQAFFVAYPLRWKRESMNKKLLWLFTLLFLVAGTFAEAQQPKKVLRIGYLTANTSSAELPRLDAFRQGLRCSAPSERR